MSNTQLDFLFKVLPRPIRTSVMRIFACTAFLMAGCSTANPSFDRSKAHHTPDGFRNNDVGTVQKPFSDLLRWRLAALRDGLPLPPQTPVPMQAADLAFIHSNTVMGNAVSIQRVGTQIRPDKSTRLSVASAATSDTAMTPQPAATWIGHATVLMQANGLNVLTDPIFSNRAFAVQIAGPQRAQPPGVALADLPRIDAVVISHNHYDHLDRNSVVALDARAKERGHDTLFLVPLGLKRWFSDLGITRVVELDWWQSYPLVVEGVGASEFTLTPVQHWSARSINDRSETLWGGWAATGSQTNWYFSGDTGYSKDFKRTHDFLSSKGIQLDLALLAIGAYEPRWFMTTQHMNPAEAVQAHLDLHARQSLGIHWGTFALTDERLDQPPKDLAVARTQAGVAVESFDVLPIGGTLLIGGRPTKVR